MIRELALALTTGRTAHQRRKCEGDIIESRAPSAGIGRMEAQTYLWVRVDVDPDLVPHLLSDTPNYKRRFYIPLERLRDRWPGGLDLARLRDPAAVYQPCLPIDALGRFLTAPTPLDGRGLIHDRETGQAV